MKLYPFYHQRFTLIPLMGYLLFAGFNAVPADMPPPSPAPTHPAAKVTSPDSKPKFTKDQVRRRLAELKDLLDRGLILQEFYDRKVRECEGSP